MYIRPELIPGRIFMGTITRIFRNGNSQAVRIPAQLAFESTDEVEIERVGDELRIRPLRPSLKDAAERFAGFSPGFMSEGRGDQEQSEREGF